MIRIYGETPELEIDNNADIQDVIEVMEQLDEVYKQRSNKTNDFLTVRKETLYTSFLYVINNLSEQNTYVIEEVINLWERFDKSQQDNILDKLFIQLDNIADEKIHTWYEKHQPSGIY